MRPQHGDERHHGEALHHGGQHVLLAHQAAIEQRQPGAGHHQHQRGADQHPGVVGRAFGVGDLLLQLRNAVALRSSRSAGSDCAAVGRRRAEIGKEWQKSANQPHRRLQLTVLKLIRSKLFVMHFGTARTRMPFATQDEKSYAPAGDTDRLVDGLHESHNWLWRNEKFKLLCPGLAAVIAPIGSADA